MDVGKMTQNGVWTIGRKLAVTIIISCFGMSATGATLTWKAASWAEGIENRLAENGRHLTAIDEKMVDPSLVSIELIDLASRLSVCEARIADMRQK